MDPNIRVEEDSQSLRIYGVRYSFEFFRAMAERMGEGTVVDAVRRNDGKWGFTSFRPGGRKTNDAP